MLIPKIDLNDAGSLWFDVNVSKHCRPRSVWVEMTGSGRVLLRFSSLLNDRSNTWRLDLLADGFGGRE